MWENIVLKTFCTKSINFRPIDPNKQIGNHGKLIWNFHARFCLIPVLSHKI